MFDGNLAPLLLEVTAVRTTGAASGFASARTVRTVVLAAAGFLAVAFLVEAAFLVAIDYIPPLTKI
jgi:hypothetical protein